LSVVTPLERLLFLPKTGADMTTSSETAVVVYEKTTGKIVHVHHDVILAGAAGPGRPESETNAITAAIRANRDASELATLVIHPGALVRGHKYGVDLDRKELSAIRA
jgi:hypothetical protein